MSRKVQFNNQATIASQESGGFTLKGILDLSSVSELWSQSAELFANSGNNVTINLGEIERADSAGLALLVSWKRWAKTNNKSMAFTQVPDQVAALADTNNLAAFLGIGT